MGKQPRQAPRQESRQVSRSKSHHDRLVKQPPIELDDQDLAHLVLESLCHSRTIQRWAAGKPVRRTTHRRLQKAMQKLGMKPKARSEVAA